MEVETINKSKLGNLLTLFIIVVVIPIFLYITQNIDNNFNHEVSQTCNVNAMEKFMQRNGTIDANTIQSDEFKNFNRCLHLHLKKTVANILFFNQIIL